MLLAFVLLISCLIILISVFFLLEFWKKFLKLSSDELNLLLQYSMWWSLFPMNLNTQKQHIFSPKVSYFQLFLSHDRLLLFVDVISQNLLKILMRHIFV